MIEIRQKKQALHNQIRKGQLKNYFKYIRINLLQKSQTPSEIFNEQKIKRMMQITLDQNQIIHQIRNNNFLHSLHLCIQNTYRSDNNEDKRLLLILIANILKNNIQIQEKEQIFRESIKVIKSLQILSLNLKEKKDLLKFNQMLKIIDPAIFMYYFSQIFYLSCWLEEQDQIWIENNAYPMFSKLLFFTIKNSFPSYFLEQFIQQTQSCFHRFFDENQESYQTNNKMKAQRNMSLFRQMQENHLYIIAQNGQFCKQFERIQAKLYWFYDKISALTIDLRPSFAGNYLTFQLICKQFSMKTDRSTDQKALINRSCYSLLRSLIDDDIYITQINQLMMRESENHFKSNFQIILREADDSKQNIFEILQLIKGLVNNFCQNKQFKELVNVFWKKIIDLSLKQIEYFIDDKYNFEKHKSTLINVLSILFNLIDFGNQWQNLSKRKNFYLLYFQSLRGMNQLQVVRKILEQYGDDSDSSIEQIMQYIDVLLVSIIEIDDK